jgi:hypothetical protein
MNLKYLLAIAVCGLVAFSAGAAEKKYPKPRKSEVIVVSRVVVDPAIDDEFYTKYYFPKIKDLKTDLPKGYKKDETVRSTICLIQPSAGKKDSKKEDERLGDVGDLLFIKMQRGDDGTVPILGFKLLLADLNFLEVNLPVYAAAVVPEDENFVYLGTLVYHRGGNFFDIVDADKVDEFEEAQKAVEEHYGSDARLVRVPLKSLGSESQE